ncbi:MAG: putative RNA binding protein YcfA (HicA-like mRNA interferase family) [Candidatus Nitrosomirales archaeon]
MKLPVVSGKQAIKALSKIGFVAISQQGSHVKLLKRINGDVIQIIIPVHGNKPLKKGLLSAVIKDAGLTVEEFTKLL